jgi:hypothetical protein
MFAGDALARRRRDAARRYQAVRLTARGLLAAWKSHPCVLSVQSVIRPVSGVQPDSLPLLNDAKKSRRRSEP